MWQEGDALIIRVSANAKRISGRMVVRTFSGDSSGKEGIRAFPGIAPFRNNINNPIFA
jgi:hypothetical protein